MISTGFSKCALRQIFDAQVWFGLHYKFDPLLGVTRQTVADKPELQQDKTVSECDAEICKVLNSFAVWRVLLLENHQTFKILENLWKTFWNLFVRANHIIDKSIGKNKANQVRRTM